MTNLDTHELIATARLGLSRATLALLDGDARLAELAQRNEAVFPTTSSQDEVDWSGTAAVMRIGAATVDLATVASKRAPKRAVPDRLHPLFRAMAREADAMIEAAVAGRPVDPASMNRHINRVLDRAQSPTWQYGTKAARRAIDLSNAYATIAACAASMGALSGREARVA